MPLKRMMIAAVAIAGLSSLVLAAEDWPKWMGPRGNMISKEKVADWPEGGPKKLWTKETGIGFASPVAHQGKIYVFSLVDRKKEVLTAFDAKTGEEVWSQSYERANVPGGKGLEKPNWDGTRATPAIDGDRIITYGTTGDLVSRSLADGKEVWRLSVVKELNAENLEWGASSSPLVEGDRIFVQAAIGQRVPVAIAVNKTDGKIVWQSEARGGPGAGGKFAFGASYAHPILTGEIDGARQLIVFGGRNVYGMNPATGKTLWSVAWTTDYDVNAATPVYHDGRLLISSEYSTAKGVLYKLSGKGAEPVWESRDLKCKYQPPILDNGYIYANSSGRITCVRWADGKTMWQARDRDLNLGAGGGFLRAGDRLIATSEGGRLSLLLATPEKVEAIRQVDLLEGSNIWSTPLLYDGKLYVKGVEELVCLDVGGKGS